MRLLLFGFTCSPCLLVFQFGEQFVHSSKIELRWISVAVCSNKPELLILRHCSRVDLEDWLLCRGVPAADEPPRPYEKENIDVSGFISHPSNIGARVVIPPLCRELGAESVESAVDLAGAAPGSYPLALRQLMKTVQRTRCTTPGVVLSNGV